MKFRKNGVGKIVDAKWVVAKQAELVKALFEYMPAFPLSHACIVTDLTPIVTIDRRVRLPLSQGRGHGDESFSVWWTSRVSESMFQLRRLWLLSLGVEGDSS